MSNVVKAIAATDTGERIIKPVKSRLFQDVFSMKELFGICLWMQWHDIVLALQLKVTALYLI